jgi:ABC-type dipeptide/oligopeptide/nickel transport system permease subunit
MAAATPEKVAPRDRLPETTLRSYLLSLARLDFLNLGVSSPTPSLGELLRQAKGMVVLINFIGKALLQAFDPRRLG